MPESLADSHIAYLGQSKFEEGKAHRGGLLIVAGNGTPLEFRCTAPIRPNVVQRITYGDSLKPYMFVELMGKPLLENAREKCSLVIVDDPAFLNLRAAIKEPVVFLRWQATGSQLGASAPILGVDFLG